MIKSLLLLSVSLTVTSLVFAGPDEDQLTSKDITYKDRFGQIVTEHHEIKTEPKVTVVPDGACEERWQTQDWDRAGACNHVRTHRYYHLKGDATEHEVTEEGTMRTNGDNISLAQLAAALLKAFDASSGRGSTESGSSYDDENIIRMYLRDSGYRGLSAEQISQVSSYMHKNGIKHVSELGL